MSAGVRTATAPVALGALVVALAGCGGSPSAPVPSAPAPTSTAATTSTAPPSSPSSPTSSVSSPTPSSVPSFALREDLPTATPMRAATTVTGVVARGVEAGCLLLSGTPYLLVGDVPDELVGRAVTVRGRAEPAAVTTCQQGTPFLVQTVRAR